MVSSQGKVNQSQTNFKQLSCQPGKHYDMFPTGQNALDEIFTWRWFPVSKTMTLLWPLTPWVLQMKLSLASGRTWSCLNCTGTPVCSVMLKQRYFACQQLPTTVRIFMQTAINLEVFSLGSNGKNKILDDGGLQWPYLSDHVG